MKQFNKICNTHDWEDAELSEMMAEIKAPFQGKHRKTWEWSIGMLAFKKAGKLDNDCVFLGIGSGTEYPIFYLTNHSKYVVATDLYSMNGKWDKYNSKVGMLVDPDTYAPYTYNRNRLGVQVMSGTDLRFDDNTFDGIFTYSSIEHFGSKDNAKKCIQEIERVLKHGGVASIATEIFIDDGANLDGAREKYSQFPIKLFNRYMIFNEMFTKAELEDYIINATNLKLTSPMDYTASAKDVVGAIKYPIRKQHDTHVFLDLNGIKWGSVHITLMKE